MIDERFVLDPRRGGDIRHQHLSRYRFAGSFAAGKRVIDVACGTGYGSAMLADLGAAHVAGADVSAESIAEARRTWPRTNVDFIQMDAADIGQRGKVDLVVSFETIEHLEDPERFLEAVKISLAAEGRFIVSTPERQEGSLQDRPTNPFHVREWSREEFVRLLERHFRSVTVYGQYLMTKSPYPLSRTVKRLIAGSVYPGLRDALYTFPVLEAPPAPGRFRMTCAYMVAVCEGPLLKEGT